MPAREPGPALDPETERPEGAVSGEAPGGRSADDLRPAPAPAPVEAGPPIPAPTAPRPLAIGDGGAPRDGGPGATPGDRTVSVHIGQIQIRGAKSRSASPAAAQPPRAHQIDPGPVYRGSW
jgi:hypothetical protein